MLRFQSYDIVFREVPGEVTLAINLSNCPNRCKGCHSPALMEDKGGVLNEEVLAALFGRYSHALTCVCFMGGDASPGEVEQLAAFLHRTTNHRVKVAWYSGKQCLPEGCNLQRFDFIKLGPYVESLGGLDSPATNQRFYRIEGGEMIDETARFFTELRVKKIKEMKIIKE